MGCYTRLNCVYMLPQGLCSHSRAHFSIKSAQLSDGSLLYNQAPGFSTSRNVAYRKYYSTFQQKIIFAFIACTWSIF